MSYQKVYNLFISHAWRYGDDYKRLVDLLNQAVGFDYNNYSAPKHKPLHNLDSTDVTKKLEIKQAIDRKISPASCVLVISGMYAAYREWMQYEIGTAVKMGKPIIGVRPWGSERIPEAVNCVADEIVGWNTSSIVSAIKRLG